MLSASATNIDYLITNMTKSLRILSAALTSLVFLASSPLGRAEDTVKVGVLHDLSGTMAISETSLRDILLFAFDEINEKGGVLGNKIEPDIVDGFELADLREKAKQLLEEDKVAVCSAAGLR